jgi:hypothetical protein
VSHRQRRRKEKQRRHDESLGPSGARRLAVGAGLTVGATLAMAGTAQATDFTVNNAGDAEGTCPTDTTCSLRQAINSANANSGSDNILFDSGLSGSTIILASEPPPITGPTNIVGIGADQLAVDGNGAHKIFDINQTTPGDAVSISDLTVQNGCCAGGIRSPNANLTVSDAVITGNSAIGRGAGIYSSGPSLTVERSTVSGNIQTGGNAGGGIFAYYELTLTDSTISGNTAGVEGGGVYVGLSYSFGGTDHHSGPHLIENSTIVGNTAGGNGGGVNFCGSPFEADRLTIESSTISGNDAAGTAGAGGAYGGGVANYCGAGYSGAILQNTIVAGNTAATADPDVNADSPVDASFSLIGVDSGGITEGVSGSNITGVDPVLAALADNGGPTETQALAESSPAIDQGSTALTTDQRGLLRPFDVPGIDPSVATGADSSDMGAFERQAGDPAVRFLTVSTGGTGSGTVTGTGVDCNGTAPDCSQAFTGGTVVDLTATPSPGSSFAGWTGCDSATGSQCTMTMSADKSVTAVFNAIPVSPGTTPPPTTTPSPAFNLRAAISKCKKKFPKGPKRKKCIKRAKRRAGV